MPAPHRVHVGKPIRKGDETEQQKLERLAALRHMYRAEMNTTELGELFQQGVAELRSLSAQPNFFKSSAYRATMEKWRDLYEVFFDDWTVLQEDTPEYYDQIRREFRGLTEGDTFVRLYFHLIVDDLILHKPEYIDEFFNQHK